MAEERQFHLEIVTPDRQFFIGEAQELTVPAIDGSLGVLAGHEPAVTALEPGELRYPPAESGTRRWSVRAWRRSCPTG